MKRLSERAKRERAWRRGYEAGRHLVYGSAPIKEVNVVFPDGREAKVDGVDIWWDHAVPGEVRALDSKSPKAIVYTGAVSVTIRLGNELTEVEG